MIDTATIRLASNRLDYRLVRIPFRRLSLTTSCPLSYFLPCRQSEIVSFPRSVYVRFALRDVQHSGPLPNREPYTPLLPPSSNLPRPQTHRPRFRRSGA